MTTGLLLVDIQNDYFPGGKMELAQPEKAGRCAARLLNAFREQGRPVFHVRHLSLGAGASFFLPDSEGAQIHASVQPKGGEGVIEKNFPNSFRETNLEERLRLAAVTDLVV